MIQIRTNPNMTVAHTVPRSWVERLTSWPWRPWRSTRTIQVPSDDCYMMGRDVMICHPEKAKQIRRMCADAAVRPLVEKLVPEILAGRGLPDNLADFVKSVTPDK